VPLGDKLDYHPFPLNEFDRTLDTTTHNKLFRELSLVWPPKIFCVVGRSIAIQSLCHRAFLYNQFLPTSHIQNPYSLKPEVYIPSIFDKVAGQLRQLEFTERKLHNPLCRARNHMFPERKSQIGII